MRASNQTENEDAIRLIPARRGYTVAWRGRALLSRIDPAGQAERLAALCEPKPQTLYICPRPLLGYGLLPLLQKLPETSALAAVETDDALAAWTARHIDKRLFASPRFALLLSKTHQTILRQCGELYGSCAFRRVELFAASSAWRETAESAAFYQTLVEKAREAIALQWGNAMTLTKLGRLYARNTIRNLPLLARCADAAALDFGADDVLVAGAGPSLEEAARQLAAAAGREKRRRVIAVDTALPVLLAWGIRPDLVVVLEAQHWNAGDFTGLYGQDIPVAMDISALPLTARIFSRPPVLFWTEWTPLRFLERLKSAGLLPLRLPALGSVGLSAYALARHLTVGDITAAGLDFAYTPSLYHCRASPSHCRALRETTRLHCPYPLASIYREGSFSAGSSAKSAMRTDPGLVKYKRLFEELKAIGYTGINDEAEKPRPGNASKERALAALTRDEQRRLEELRAILTGAGREEDGAGGLRRLESLLDESDYLWAHFPDCAGRDGRRPPASDTGFLKRVRAEIDPFLALLNAQNAAAAAAGAPPMPAPL